MKNSGSREDLEKLEQTAQGIAQIVGPMFDRAGAAFALIGFEFGPGGWATWVSNAQRPDMIRALREMATVLERGGDMPAIQPGEPEA